MYMYHGLDYYLYFRWHHVESTMNGGITTSVNFWYKVSIAQGCPQSIFSGSKAVSLT